MLFALLRDRHYVKNAKIWADDVVERCSRKASERLDIAADEFSIEIRLVGHNASFGDIETQARQPVEIGAMGIVTAKSEELAMEIGRMLNPYLLHHPLTAQEEQPTFAFPFSPAEINVGPVFEFCLNHVMEIDDPMAAFSLHTVEMTNG